jgi:lipoyl(octanoyl) transferase
MLSSRPRRARKAALCYRSPHETTGNSIYATDMDTATPLTRHAPCAPTPTVRRLGRAEYEPTWRAMQEFTARRDAATPDEIWLTEHPPVYTLGLAGKPEHLLRADTGIPVVKIDRGGQITYHGPGQLVAYLLLDMKRRSLSVRALVRKMESAVINLLHENGVAAHHRADAPGVYVTRDGAQAKIAALGLRVKNGCCYHGLALNIDMDLTPFRFINPCGYAGMRVTQLADLGVRAPLNAVGDKLAQHLLRVLT